MSDAAGNEARPPRGLKGDIHRAREGAKATAEELREFVGEFRGKGAKEMLGLVAASNLVQSTVLATFITVIFLGGFTVGPYVWHKWFPPVVAKKSKPEPTPAAATKTDGDAAKTPAATAAGTADAGKSGSPSTAANTSPSSPKTPGVPADPVLPGSPEALNRLGVGETKTLDSKNNPLENSTDDLLKDLGKKTK